MINEKDRNAVRIIELPSCKMIWSGVCPGTAGTSENVPLRKFSEWWSAFDKLRKDRFYARDFMWYDGAAGGMAWGLAVADIPADTGGFEVIDFPGGLYAVANYADGDAEGAYTSINKWVEESDCFIPDGSRNHMWHCFGCCSEPIPIIMGYNQYDFYFPILVKGEAK